MGPRERVAAMLAAPAGPRLRAGAEQPLTEPEGEALLADTQWSVQKQRAGEGIAPDRVVEPAAEGGVAMKRQEGHARRYAESALVRKALGASPAERDVRHRT